MREKVKNLRESDGFTIIEVLIVLAIAGLIMLIVFLAVPALQRNSRNTQRKNDASAIMTAVSEYTSNNNGVAPTSKTQITAVVPTTKRAYYKDDTKVTLVTTGSTSNVVTDSEGVTIQIGSKCGTNGAGQQSSVSGPSRSIVVLYAVETTSGTVPQCLESGV